ncbi:hypothetical protein KAT51_06840 [bacterium]|nr:hypothetical protein [bacterium]
MQRTFNIILFLGRPGAGKSEVIDFLEKTPLNMRIKRYYIGDYIVLDDFKFLWEKGEEDDMIEELGRERLYTYTHKTGYGASNSFLFKLLIKKFNQAFKNLYHEYKNIFEKHTVFIEFSRGGKEEYAQALSLFDKYILENSVLLYMKVSYKEAYRRNIRRYETKKKNTILQHTVPVEIMKKYKTDDWDQLISSSKQYVNINDVLIPYAVLKNEPEITDKPDILNTQLGKILTDLKKAYDIRAKK